jgi:uncharacterized protein (DUF1810 family)
MSTLNRHFFFEVAQEEVWEEAMNEIRTGRMQTHRMWFVLPNCAMWGKV